MLNVTQLNQDVMKKLKFSNNDLENKSARIVLGELITKQKDVIGEITSEIQYKMLNKMKSDREKTAQIYLNGGRNDLAEYELCEVKIINNLIDVVSADLPKLFTEDQTIELIKSFKQSNPNCKIGDFMKYVGANQLNVDKKLAAKLFNSI